MPENDSMATPINDEEFAKRSRDFIYWLKQNGATISPKIQLVDLRSRNAGRGVVAREDILDDEELFRIPNPSILAASTSSIPEELANSLEDPWLALILAMVYEYRQRAESRWKPYFDVLPSHFDTLMYWSEAELQLLQGSAVVNKIGKHKANEAFTTHILPLIRRHDATFHATNLTDSQILALCHRMGSTIMAYAFDMENSSQTASQSEQDGWEEDSSDDEIQPKGMVPLADMLNADATRNNARLFHEVDAVVMKALRPIAAGEELLNDYGPLPRADLLRRYGYTTDNYADYDVVEISLELVKEVAKTKVQGTSDVDIDARVEYLEEQGAVDDGYDISHPSHEDGHFSDELNVLLNALAMSSSDFDRLRSKDKLPKPTLMPEGLHLLHGILLERETMYPKLEFGDTAERPNGNSMIHSTAACRTAMAEQVIRGEKAVLTAAVSTVSELIAFDKKRKIDESDSKPSQSHPTSSKKMKTNGR